MAAHLLRLRIALIVGALRGRQRVRMASGAALILAGAVLACAGLAAIANAAAPTAFVVTVIAGSAMTVGFAVAALLSRSDDPVDPRRFALFDFRAREVAVGAGLAGAVSVPVLGATIVAVGAVVFWSGRGVPWPVTVLSALLVVVTCVLLARVCFGAAALLLRERRSRELTGILLLALVVFVVPTAVFVFSLQWRGAVPAPLVAAARVLGETPFGAAWALPALFASGDAAGGWLSLVIALATPVVLGALWYAVTVRLLTTTERPTRAGRSELGWFLVAPSTPGGAIAARSLVYWRRDSRYLMSLVAVPVAAVLCVIPLLVANVPFADAVLLPVPVIALFLGWMPHNDVAYDATAVWIHFAADVRGFSDRIGRLVPVLLIGLPALGVLIPVAMVLHGHWSTLPMMIGLCAALYLSGLGLSSISSALAPYPVTLPGDSPLRQPERVGVAAVVSPALVLLGALACAVPVLAWSWAAWQGDAVAADYALWGGIGIGLAVLVGGVAGGSAVFERRRSRLMEFAESL
ncbi:hypothetical protein LK09_11435 [Microbacterium mangrovi]|uniref:Uncharacterized protein n=1 Tax=Microbacterium mangrovi TaxID=1348253 RepID=A0A0B2A6L7_9MICO|nr:hypothetical protein [Microbacterium mangrovi]KHK97388.1 hypothetical protein LK09_11435 [Microbacterium mangrovi]